MILYLMALAYTILVLNIHRNQTLMPIGRERVFFISSAISRLFDLIVPTSVSLYGSRSNAFARGTEVNQLSQVIFRLGHE